LTFTWERIYTDRRDKLMPIWSKKLTNQPDRI